MARPWPACLVPVGRETECGLDWASEDPIQGVSHIRSATWRLSGEPSQKRLQVFNLHRFDKLQIEARRVSPPPVLFQPIARQRSDNHRLRIWQHLNATRHFIAVDTRQTNVYQHASKPPADTASSAAGPSVTTCTACPSSSSSISKLSAASALSSTISTCADRPDVVQWLSRRLHRLR
jgi:hypothetical protein